MAYFTPSPNQTYPDSRNWLNFNPTTGTFFGQGLDYYARRRAGDQAHGTKADEVYRALGHSNANVLGTYGTLAQQLGLSNLSSMLFNEGRMDPAIMAQQQNQISRGTQQQQDAAKGRLAAKGWGGSALGEALQAAIGQAGQNAGADLRYRDISDSYARNQQNLGLLQQLVGDPTRDYAAIGAGQYGQKQQADAQKQSGWLGLIGSLVGGLS